MAAPVVSGAAAFLASYFPKLSMEDIKNILMDTATKYDGILLIYLLQVE